MGKPFGSILEGAVVRKINNLKLAAGQMNEKLKMSFVNKTPYSKCMDCGCPLTQTEVYGEWDDYCIDCYIEESSNEK
ncbi:zinc finger DNA binding protein [Erwinia phage AH04]|uniref:Zinc finger DNA binding protein n=1 Tax=Erwinia phage AH04 TaxID=2869569 RepID=A0AAE7X1X3_9CAUD|nr:zinc finger DNA binding protein [Erwinia phage AH04]QZA70656.1 zinc finger DNA binding protein [Erwinia phage AH04]